MLSSTDGEDRVDRIAVAIVDDHALIAEMIAAMLATDPAIVVVGRAGTVAGAVELLGAHPDVVLMDYRLPDGTGIEAAGLLQATDPTVRVILLTAEDRAQVVKEARLQGCAGVLHKGVGKDTVIAAVRAVARGQVLYQSEPFARPEAPAITVREGDVLRLLVDGLATKEVAEQLGISTRAVGRDVQSLMAKAGVRSRAELVAWSYRSGAQPR